MKRIAPTRILVCLLAAAATGCGGESQSEREERLLAAWQQPIGFYYDAFVESEGIPVYEGWSIPDVGELVLGPWPRLGADGAYLKLHGQQGFTGAWVLQLAPGQETKPERHLYDEVLYVLTGRGSIRLWRETGDAPTRVDWARGAMLGPPLNAWHVIANDGDAPLRIVGFTNAPPVLDLYRDAAFVFGTDHVFDRGFAGDPGYFEAGPVRRAGERWPVGDSIDPFVTNFVEDVRALTPVMHAWQDKNADFATFAMASAALSPHVSAWAPASYQRAHRHSGGAMVLLLEGSGSFMMWPREAGRQPWEDGRSDAVVRGELRPGGLYSPPTDWFHMHFNESPEPALYLAVTPQGRADRLHYVPDPFHDPLIELYAQRAEPESRFIRVEDEDPEIRQIFDAAVRAHRSDDRPTP